MSRETFDHLIAEALTQELHGWDFSWLNGRWHEAPPPWHYRALVAAALPHSQSLLDMGTGGGEFLASLAPLPPQTWATEGYPPNLPIARRCLEPLGVTVIPVSEDNHLAAPDAFFDLVINRHESFDPQEVARVLQGNGRFLTQQVGGADNRTLNHWLGDPHPPAYEGFQAAVTAASLRQAGLQIEQMEEAFPETAFFDIGAVVFYLQAIPWQVPDFSVSRYEAGLWRIHQEIEANGRFISQSHRFFIAARKAAL